MKTKIVVLLGAGLMLAGCTPPSADTTHLKPVDGAFGYILGSIGKSQEGETIENAKPFNYLSVEALPDGRIYSINLTGNIQPYELDSEKAKLVSMLTEKYGLRFQAKSNSKEVEYDYDFGTTNRTAHLEILDQSDAARFYLDYYDDQLRDMASQQQDETNKADENKLKGQL